MNGTVGWLSCFSDGKNLLPRFVAQTKLSQVNPQWASCACIFSAKSCSSSTSTASSNLSQNAPFQFHSSAWQLLRGSLCASRGKALRTVDRLRRLSTTAGFNKSPMHGRLKIIRHVRFPSSFSSTASQEPAFDTPLTMRGQNLTALTPMQTNYKTGRFHVTIFYTENPTISPYKSALQTSTIDSFHL